MHGGDPVEMKKVFQATACLLLAVACWRLGTQSGRDETRKAVENQKEPSLESTSSAGLTGRESPSPRSAPPRPALKNRPILLGRKVTVLEGTITESGSERPVKFQNHLGWIFSASAIRPGDGEEILLIAPLEVTGESLEGKIRKRDGVLTLTKDGELKAMGDIEFESSNPGKAVQPRQE